MPKRYSLIPGENRGVTETVPLRPLDEAQRFLVDVLWQEFESTARWPTHQYANHRLRFSHGLSAAAVVASFPDLANNGYRAVWMDQQGGAIPKGARIGLTVPGLAQIAEAADVVEAFLELVRTLATRWAEADVGPDRVVTLQVGYPDIVRIAGRGQPANRILVDQLMALRPHEPATWGGSWSGEEISWSWEVPEEILQFRGVRDVAAYVAVIRELAGGPGFAPSSGGVPARRSHDDVDVGQQVTLLKVLIAAPSDAGAARDQIVRTVAEWNDLHSESLGVVLLPIRWDLSAAPAMGEPPQDVINRQLTDKADLLVGTFWARLGSPTTNSQSGTVEEIERLIAKGFPVALYFSKQDVPAAALDTRQLDRLRAYQDEIKDRGFYREYSDLAELDRQVSADLLRIVREILRTGVPAGQVERAPQPQKVTPAVHGELRQIAAEMRPRLATAVARHDTDEVKAVAAEVARRLDSVAGRVARDGDPEEESWIETLGTWSERAHELAVLDVFLDGGQTSGQLKDRTEALLSGIADLGRDPSRETDPKAPRVDSQSDSQQGD